MPLLICTPPVKPVLGKELLSQLISLLGNLDGSLKTISVDTVNVLLEVRSFDTPRSLVVVVRTVR
jgi:hypothetical protein